MKKVMFLLVIIVSLAVGQMWGLGAGKRVEIKDGWCYVDGEKFFAKGIVYEGWRPHQAPGEDAVDLQLIDSDFSKIKKAGFNTIRTAGGVTEPMVKLAQKHGLMVMHGIWFEKNIDYRDPEKLEYAIGLLKNEVQWSRNYDNILCYLVMNEPPLERVEEAGQKRMEEFLRKICAAVRKLDPDTPISFANWVPLSFINHDYLDIICFNVYIWSPSTVRDSLGYRWYIEYLKKDIAPDKPLIITEFGVSVSPQRLGESSPGIVGYGGNSEEEQKTAVLEMFDELLQGGAQGGCVHELIDTWWRPSNKHAHDKGPEEWFGIMNIDNDPKGVPRPAYYALQKYNQAVIIKPQGYNYYRKMVPLEVYATEEVNSIQYQAAKAVKGNLKKQGSFWWRGKFDSRAINDGECSLEIIAKNKKGEVLCRKTVPLWIANKTVPADIPYKVKIITDKPEYKSGDMMKLTVSVTDKKGRPVAGKEVAVSYFNAVGWQDISFKRTTNKKGEAYGQYKHFGRGFLVVAAGVEYQKGNYKRRYGDLKIVECDRK